MTRMPLLRRPWRVCLAFLSLIGTLAADPVKAQDASAAGEVRRVDVAGGKVTLMHGAIADLQLPAMTLVYQAPPALLQGLQPGDKVTFVARRQNNHYVITAISK